jgi:hypothetical protein
MGGAQVTRGRRTRVAGLDQTGAQAVPSLGDDGAGRFTTAIVHDHDLELISR